MDEFEPYPEYSLSAGEEEVRMGRINVVALRKAIDVCPVIDAEGNSECPFAEAIYRKKEERGWCARKSLFHLNSLVDKATHPVCERERALSRMASGPEKDREAIEVSRHRALVDDMVHTVRQLRQVLGESDRKHYPGMKRCVRGAFDW